MSRTCWICYEALDRKEAVETSHAPWHLESGEAHRSCADEAANLAAQGNADAEHEFYRDKQGPEAE